MADFQLHILKRLASILFLLILLFNLWGYRFMIDCLQHKQDAILTSRLDMNEYNEDELISIKTSLNLPYYINSGTYERAFGSVNVNGVDYEYVKRRVYNDTLELLCLPNKAKTQLESVRDQFLKFSVDDQNTPTNKKTHHIVKSGLQDLVLYVVVMPQQMDISISKRLIVFNNSLTMQGYALQQYRPPQPAQLFM